MDFQVISQRIVGANLERTVLHSNGLVRYSQLDDTSSSWITVSQISPFWGRLRYRRQLRAMRAAA